jgi:hypothetical protein
MLPRVCNMYYYYIVYDMCWCFLWHAGICIYPVVTGSSFYCVVCSCYECLLSWVGSVLCKVCMVLSVFNSCNVSNIGLYISTYASFICSLFLLSLRMWYFSNVFRSLAFLSVFMMFTVLVILPLCVLCVVCLNNVNYHFL